MLTSTVVVSICPKCGTTKKSTKLSCCARGGTWFKNCGDIGHPNVDHTWAEGIQACKSRLLRSWFCDFTVWVFCDGRDYLDAYHLWYVGHLYSVTTEAKNSNNMGVQFLATIASVSRAATTTSGTASTFSKLFEWNNIQSYWSCSISCVIALPHSLPDPPAKTSPSMGSRVNGCPKCGSTRKYGTSSCCARGGAWFKNCGDTDNTNFDHTWAEGIEACKRRLGRDRVS